MTQVSVAHDTDDLEAVCSSPPQDAIDGTRT